jgi:predicted TIM-barrel fold metal-dependent hydrolase
MKQQTLSGNISRRAFIAGACATACGAAVSGFEPAFSFADPIIDIHQHTHYSGRSDDDLVSHQRKMGIARTVLLPAGSKFGLEADAWGNDSVVALARRYPKEFVFFANELPDIPETRPVIEKYLKLGAIGIGEQKFEVESDSKHIELIATIAKDYNVPVLLHFQHGKYNRGFERFHKILEKFPRVNFIGHAQTWWGNIDRNHDQTVMYPKTKVTPGGISDRLLADYPNMYGDLSAGSGLNAMMRDEDHAREFLKRHQNKLLYGSDCNDRIGEGEKCSGSQQLAALARLVPDEKALRRILYENASRVMKIK